jgi:hypothetical protein
MNTEATRTFDTETEDDHCYDPGGSRGDSRHYNHSAARRVVSPWQADKQKQLNKHTRMKINNLICLLLASYPLAFMASAEDVPKPALLHDGDFESSTPNGTFPDSKFWKPSWLGKSGAVCTSTAARSGRAGLWAYTGVDPEDLWTATYQEFQAKPGEIYRACAWVRTPENAPWVEGSKARIEVRFLDAAQRVLSIISAESLETPSTEWKRQNILTAPAPARTTSVRFVLLVEKPSRRGQSVANFDDAFFILAGIADLPDSNNPDALRGPQAGHLLDGMTAQRINWSALANYVRAYGTHFGGLVGDGLCSFQAFPGTLDRSAFGSSCEVCSGGEM